MDECTEDADERSIRDEKLAEELIAFSESSPFVISKVAPGKERPVSTDEPELRAAEPFPMSTLPVFKHMWPFRWTSEPATSHRGTGVVNGNGSFLTNIAKYLNSTALAKAMNAKLGMTTKLIGKLDAGRLAKWFVVSAVVLAVAGGVVGFIFASSQGNTEVGQVNAVAGYVYAMRSGNEGAASLYWAHNAVPQKYFNVLGCEVFDPRKDYMGNIYVRARITSKLPSGSSVDRLWDFYMFRDSTTGEWRIQDIKPAS
jgi:hypothetical protein